jgi:hypothetical protein
MTENGVSTTKNLGQEQYESFFRKVKGKNKKYCQYDYRHMDGELFSCVKATLEECRAERDLWLEKKRGKAMTINNKELYNLYKSVSVKDNYCVGLYIEGYNGGVNAYVTDGKVAYKKTFTGDNKTVFMVKIDDWQKKDGATESSSLAKLGNEDDRNLLPKIKAYFEKERFNAFTVDYKEFKKAVKGVDVINKGEGYHRIALSLHNGKFDLASWTNDGNFTASWQLDGEYIGDGAICVNKKYLDGVKADKTIELSFSKIYENLPEYKDLTLNGQYKDVTLHIHGDIDAVIMPIRLEGDNLTMYKEVLEYEYKAPEKKKKKKIATEVQAEKIMSEIKAMTNENDLRKELVKSVIKLENKQVKQARKPVKRVPRLKKENGAFTGWSYNRLGTKQVKVCNW